MFVGTPHPMVGVIGRIGFTVAGYGVYTGRSSLACFGVFDANLEPTHRPPVALLRDIERRFLPAKGVQNSQVCKAVLIRDISDAPAVRRPARMKMIPVAKGQLVGFTAG